MLPAELLGISHGGNILYTVGYDYDTNGAPSFSEYLSALAYDGIKTYLVSSIPTMPLYYRNHVVQNDQVYRAKPVTAPTETELESWRLNAAGQFQKTGSLTLGYAPLRLDTIGETTLSAHGYGHAFQVSIANGMQAAGAVVYDRCLPAAGEEARLTLAGTLLIPSGEMGLYRAEAAP
jgi:hypothetical protein